MALRNKALRALFSYSKVLNTQCGASIKTQLHLFDSLVKPILLYGSEVWGAYMFRRFNVGKLKDNFCKPVCDLESVQMKACRYILGVNKKSCIQACLGELGRLPLFVSVIEDVVKYWFRLKCVDDDSLLADAYKVEKQLYKVR